MLSDMSLAIKKHLPVKSSSTTAQVEIDCLSVPDGIARFSKFALSGGYAVCGEEDALRHSLPLQVSGAGNGIYRKAANL